jgi:hypothetical protein
LISFSVALFWLFLKISSSRSGRSMHSPPRAKPFIAFDADVKGFGCRVQPSGLKTFVLEYRPGAGGRSYPKRRLTLGRYGSITPDQARKAALSALAQVRLGSDPQALKSRQRTALTVSGLIDAYLDDHGGKLKPRTRDGYEALLGKLRAAHGGIKAEALNRSQVAVLHRSLSATPYAANRMLAAVSSLYGWAVDHSFCPKAMATRRRASRDSRNEAANGS